MGKVSAAHLDNKISVNTQALESLGQDNKKNGQKLLELFEDLEAANKLFVNDYVGDSEKNYSTLFSKLTERVNGISEKFKSTGNLLNDSAFIYNGINQKAGDIFSK